VSRSFVTIALVAGMAASGAASVAFAQAAGASPSWDTLVKCAQTPDESARLACYDAAMRAAGYSPNPEAVAAEHHKAFGLSMPKVTVFKKKKQEEGAEVAGAAPAPPVDNPNQTEITVDQIAITQPAGKIIIFSTDGQIWRQVDTTSINNLPKEGDTVPIHKEVLGGYFCDVNKYQSVRCQRVK